MVKNHQNLVFINIFITKISKTFDFFSKNQKKSCHVFLGAFIWNHPTSSCHLNDSNAWKGANTDSAVANRVVQKYCVGNCAMPRQFL